MREVPLGGTRLWPVRAEHAATACDLLRRLRLGERCVCDLTDALDAAQLRLSFRLKVLKDAASSDRREGRSMYCTLNTETLGTVAEVIESMASAPARQRLIR